MTPKITVIRQKISSAELRQLASESFGDMIKAVVDVERSVMALGGEMHADEERQLLDDGSRQENLWGINLYVDLPLPDFIEFDSMINLRPRQGNRSRGVESEDIRQKIVAVARTLIDLP